MGTYLPGTGTLGWGNWCGSGTPHSQDIPSEFLSTTLVYGTSPFHICASPASLDGCGFFNSVGSDLYSTWFLMVLSDGFLYFSCNFDVVGGDSTILTGRAYHSFLNFYFWFSPIFIKFLFIFRERGKGREREGEKHQCMDAFAHPQLGIWPTTRCVLWLGIKTATPWFTGQHSIHWATPARAEPTILKCQEFRYSLM